MSDDQTLPQRDCAGCGQTDDHPRLNYRETPDGDDLLFHYDCVPHYLRHLVPEPALKATAAGKRGAAVREAVLKHVAKTAEEA